MTSKKGLLYLLYLFGGPAAAAVLNLEFLIKCSNANHEPTSILKRIVIGTHRNLFQLSVSKVNTQVKIQPIYRSGLVGPAAYLPGQPSRTKRQRLDFQKPGNRLAVKLLEMVGRGETHISTVAEIARVAVEDTGPKAAKTLEGIASCGSNGKHASNTERDFRRMVRETYNMRLEPYSIQLKLEAS